MAAICAMLRLPFIDKAIDRRRRGRWQSPGTASSFGSMSGGYREQFFAAADAGLAVGRAQVVHGQDGQVEQACHLLGCQAAGDELEHLGLAADQAAPGAERGQGLVQAGGLDDHGDLNWWHGRLGSTRYCRELRTEPR